MSIAINVDKVSEVLLADGWHTVANLKDGTPSFDLDAYEYIVDEDSPGNGRVLLGGGMEKLVPATGFTFIETITDDTNIETGTKRTRIAGPLTAILAVRYSRR